MTEPAPDFDTLPGAPVLVLVAMQDIVNIASAVRLARNFGIDQIRLVQPEVFDPWRIEGIAHNTADLVARIEIVDTLDAALADCAAAYVLTGRERAAKRSIRRPREAAGEMVARAAEGRVALVAGREDSGLTNEELDRCDVLVTIPACASYTSLNVSHAIAVMAYELWLARGGQGQPFKAPRREAPPATHQDLEYLFQDWESALWAIEFFKTRLPESVLRSFREVVFRAGLDHREAKLLRAMGIEVVRYLERSGVPGGQRPRAPGGGTGTQAGDAE